MDYWYTGNKNNFITLVITFNSENEVVSTHNIVAEMVLTIITHTML